ncbi:MAG: 30S ribosomal protein S1 [Rickettsiales bacterium]|jgi:small subunit ribosomal protein S1|nr:30S ribosomal protein S1 [Rickettsiales bacterium]
MTYLKENFEELLDQFSSETQSFEEGSILKGVIISVDEKIVGVDIGTKSVGYIPINEFRDKEIKVGDVIDVLLNKVENKKGELLISFENAKKVQLWNLLKQYVIDNTSVEGKILGKVKGGFAIDIDGIIAFLPKSQIDPIDILNFGSLIGTKEKFAVLKVDDERNNVVVSKRAVMDSERLKERDKIFSTLKIGDTMEGIVKNLTDYGAFVDFGSFDGLLHLTDISWSRIRHPSDVLKMGQNIKVQIIKYDPETKKVSLGYKQLQTNPWETIKDKLPVGTIIKGKINVITQYGIFVDTEFGIEGLVHVSEVSWSKNTSQIIKSLQVGQEVDVMVLEIDTEHHRISLGMRQTTPNPWKTFADAHSVGDEVEGIVRNFTDFGIFIELSDNLDALLHASDLEKETDMNNYSKGDKIKVVLLATSVELGKISVGVKQLQNNLKETIKKYERDASVSVIVKNVKKEYLDVEVEDSGLKAIIKRVDLAKDRKDQRTERFKVGDIISGKIILFDPKDGKFFVSIKPLSAINEDNEEENDFNISNYDDTAKKNTLGSVFSGLFEKLT